MTRSIKTRLEALENKQPDKKFIAIFQDWDDPDLWHPGDRENDPIRGWENAEAQYKDHVIFRVIYTDDWKE